MTGLLEIKDRLIRFYSKYETFLFPVIKFALALALFAMINAHVGYMEVISNWPTALALAVLCALLPVNATIWLAGFVVLADMYALSLEVALTALVLFAALFFLYFRFSPEHGILAVLTPVSFGFRIPYLMPVAGGLLCSVSSVPAVVCGTVVYYFLDGIHQNAGTLASVETAAEGQPTRFDISIGQLLGNKEMYLVIAIFVVTAVVVYTVRRMEADYAWTLAIISGMLIEIAGMVVGYILLGMNEHIVIMLAGNLVSMCIAFIIQFLFMNLDYARTERVQFEDDDYYYYVKAVPKKMVAVKDVKVKHFGNTGSMGKRIDHSSRRPDAREEENSRKVLAKELDIDEKLLK